MCGPYFNLKAPKAPAVSGYDIHIYVDELACGIRKSPERSKKGNDLAEALIKAIPQAEGPFQVQAGMGPHVLSNVEITIPPESLSQALTFLQLNNPGLSILVHPHTGDEIKDHTDLALWVGPPVLLALNKLTPPRKKTGNPFPRQN